VKQYSESEIEVVNKHLQNVLVHLGKALAVCHEGMTTDTETLGSILNDINLEAWRMRWLLGATAVSAVDAMKGGTK